MGNGTQNGTQNGSMNGTGSGNGRMNDGMNGTGSGNMNGSQSGSGTMNGGTHNSHMNGMGNGTMNGGRMNGNGMTTPRDGDTIPHSMNNGCGDMSDDCLDGRPLAYVYAPNQRFCMLYSAKDALDRGTLFEALYKPMEVYGRE
jgi:hypothetical protein